MESTKKFFKTEYKTYTRQQKIDYWFSYSYRLMRASSEDDYDIFTKELLQNWREKDPEIDEIILDIIEHLDGFGLDKEILIKNMGIEVNA